MTEKLTPVPRIAIQSIGGGLLLMTLFTTMWTGIAQGGLAGRDHHLVLIIFSSLSATFFFYGIRLFFVARSFPKVTTDADEAEGKLMLKQFAIIFGIEGTAIPVTCGLLFITGYQQFVLPAIALIVGLHFYPMAKIFNRTIDYYVATWTVLCALASICLMNTSCFDPGFHLSFLGIGVASATATYGLYMLYEGQRLTRKG
jgi:hypothetical protein